MTSTWQKQLKEGRANCGAHFGNMVHLDEETMVAGAEMTCSAPYICSQEVGDYSWCSFLCSYYSVRDPKPMIRPHPHLDGSSHLNWLNLETPSNVSPEICFLDDSICQLIITMMVQTYFRLLCNAHIRAHGAEAVLVQSALIAHIPVRTPAICISAIKHS